MAELRLFARRGASAGAGVTMFDSTATDYGYRLLTDVDWSNPSPDYQQSSRQDGVTRATQARLEPRIVRAPIRIVGTGATAALIKASLVARVSALEQEARACARSGGTLRWKSNSVTYPVNFEVASARLITPQGWAWEMNGRVDAMLELTVDPLALADPMDFIEDFGARSDGTTALGDFTLDAGAATLTLGADIGVRPRGALVPSSTANKRARHTARGWTYTDAAVTMLWRTGASVASADFAVGLFDSAGNGLLARIQGAGTNQIQVCTMAAGTPTAIATTAFTPAANTYYWLRFIRSGPEIRAQVFSAAPPFLMSTPAFEATFALTPTQQQAAPGGQPGFRSTPTATDERFMGLDVRPYTYLAGFPDVARLTGIPGDVEALASFEFGVPSSFATQPVWGMAAWDRRMPGANLCWNGGGQDNPSVVGTQGWATTVVANIITVASTSVARNAASSRYSGSCLEFVSIVTANSGVGFQLNRRFRRGRRQVALGWLSSAAGTGTAQIVLGNTTEGSPATSAAVALAAAYAFHSCVWTPTADRDVATVGVRHVTGSVETTRFDGIQVYESTPVTLSASIASTGATSCTATADPPEGWEFFRQRLAGGQVVGLVDSELVRIDAIDPATRILTITRGFDGTTAATHSSGATVDLIANYNPQLDGAHFSGGVDIAGAASPWLANPVTALVNNADAATRAGFDTRTTSVITTQQWSFMIDPATLAPGDFEDDRMLCEVWGRFAYDSSTPGLRIAIGVGDDDSAGRVVLDLEQGSSGLAHSTGVAVWRFERLGVVSIRHSDVVNRKRVQLALTATWTSIGFAITFDYLMLTRPGKRLLLPTGVDYLAGSTAEMFTGSSVNATRKIYSDLTSEVWRHDVAYQNEYHQPGSGMPVGGVVGAPALLPVPNVDVLAKISSQVPNSPTAPTTTEVYSLAAQFGVSVGITPRFLTIR